jgi:hypothetical protein
MAQPTNKQPPLRRLNTRVDPWGNALRTPSSGSAAKDVFPHLPSAVRPEVEQPKEKENRRTR